MKKIFLSIVLIISSTLSSQNVEFPYSILLKDMEGNEFNSKKIDNKGKPIIIDFWASYCKPCIVKYNTFKEIYDDWQKKTGVKIIIVSIDKENRINAAKKLINKFNWPFEAYFDSNQELMTKIIGGKEAVPRSAVFNGSFNIILKKSGAKIFSSKDPDNPMKAIKDIYVKNKEITSEYKADITEYIKAVNQALK